MKILALFAAIGFLADGLSGAAIGVIIGFIVWFVGAYFIYKGRL